VVVKIKEVPNFQRGKGTPGKRNRGEWKPDDLDRCESQRIGKKVREYILFGIGEDTIKGREKIVKRKKRGIYNLMGIGCKRLRSPRVRPPHWKCLREKLRGNEK